MYSQKNTLWVLAGLFCSLTLTQDVFAGDEVCFYKNEQGVVREVRSRRQIPKSLVASAKCFTKAVKRSGSPSTMAKPDEIDLGEGIRKERISTPLGPMELRYSRSAEKVLGRNPLRATTDAARMVSKALRQSGFPGSISRMDREWKVVFMDANVPGHQVPTQLMTNCHPAWMTPPANIYMVVQRVVAGCGQSTKRSSKEENDAKVAEVLAHEMGHVVESDIMGTAFAGDRLRSEGFATWFEATAAEFSRIIPRGSVFRTHQGYARSSFRASPKALTFRGSAEDYSRASMYFHALVKARGVKGVIRVYGRIKAGSEKQFLAAIKAETGWSSSTLEKKARAAAGL